MTPIFRRMVLLPVKIVAHACRMTRKGQNVRLNLPGEKFERTVGALALILALLIPASRLTAAEAAGSSPALGGRVVTERLESTVLRGTRTGLNPVREFFVYLPEGYDRSGRAYPVVYYCHSIFQGPAQVLGESNLIRRIEAAVARGGVG